MNSPSARLLDSFSSPAVNFLNRIRWAALFFLSTPLVIRNVEFSDLEVARCTNDFALAVVFDEFDI